ncbi:hypothetical protein OG870_16500 [Streptomyces sp. NBC_00461]|uniref:hypothetical protein n=1 Tax=Streptomyces sp. NBC_00461 TaxID=2975750 RepID=UPI002E16F6CD
MAEERIRDSIATSLSTAYERVLLEGPEEVAGAAAELGVAVEDATHVALTWLMEVQADSALDQRDFASELRRARESASRRRLQFRMIAMDVVRSDGGGPESEQAQLRTAIIAEQLRQQSADSQSSS